MEKIVIKPVTGLSESATNWEKRQNKRYGKISNVCRQTVILAQLFSVFPMTVTLTNLAVVSCAN
jgi:hypothetical protein